MEMIKDLQETVYAMTSDNYKQRFIAEYTQVVIRNTLVYFRHSAPL